MENLQEIMEILFEQGYTQSGNGIYRIKRNQNTPDEIWGYIFIDDKGLTYTECNMTTNDSHGKLFVSHEIEAFAIVHMLIYVGAIDAKKVFSKQLKGMINESVI